eukprot:12875570-Alexandrium_andersonii.AAC.1
MTQVLVGIAGALLLERVGLRCGRAERCGALGALEQGHGPGLQHLLAIIQRHRAPALGEEAN